MCIAWLQYPKYKVLWYPAWTLENLLGAKGNLIIILTILSVQKYASVWYSESVIYEKYIMLWEREIY